MNLSGKARDPVGVIPESVKSATVKACGLGRAFSVAGTETLVMSLWRSATHCPAKRW